MSSAKILNFLVNDILDFAQMRSGKFRKDCFNFKLNEAIDEIVSIEQFKADQCGISIDLKYHNFEDESSFLVCTD